MKVKGIVAQSCLTLWGPMDSRVHGILQIGILEWVAIPFSRGSSQHRDWTRSPTFQVPGTFSRGSSQHRDWTRSPTFHIPAELPGNPKNTGVASLSLLQKIFLTQESIQGFLHCKWILYQLGYQGRTCHGYGQRKKTNCGDHGIIYKAVVKGAHEEML